jgi:hypothetical protein
LAVVGSVVPGFENERTEVGFLFFCGQSLPSPFECGDCGGWARHHAAQERERAPIPHALLSFLELLPGPDQF